MSSSAPSSAGDLHVLEVAGELLRAHCRSHLHALDETVADAERRGRRGQGRGEAVGDALLDDHPAGGRAALAGESEAAHHHQPHGQFEVGVVEDDDGILATHLQLHAREVLRGARVDPGAGGVRPREGQAADDGVAGERAADGGA